MYETEESIKKVQQLVIEAIATGVKELCDEHSRKLISKHKVHVDVADIQTAKKASEQMAKKHKADLGL